MLCKAWPVSAARARADRSGTVFIAEDEESSFNGTDFDHYLTGRFAGYLDQGNRMGESFEGLSLDEALDWARKRADRIVVRVGRGPEYALGFASAAREAWPPGGVAQPVRRRVPEQAWKDRTDADPDATWQATLALAPPESETADQRRPEWDDVVVSVADDLGATWSADNLDAWFVVMRSAQRRARRSPSGEAGWATHHTRAYEIEMTVRAPTASRARATALARMPRLPDGWSVQGAVRFLAD